MSQLEVYKNRVFSQTFVALVAGVGAVVTPANYNASSELLSIVRVTAGGTVGEPKCRTVIPSSVISSVYGLGLFSANALDTSVYTVYWCNGYNASTNFIQGGALAGAQFSP